MSLLEDAARRWAAAYVHTLDMPRDLTGAVMELDDAAHQLVLLAGERCPYCDDGTCPGVDMLIGRPIVDKAAL